MRVLEILSLPAPDQCRAMGNFNVAWELRDDALAGEYLINGPVSRATPMQHELLRELFRELRELPVDAINQPNTTAGNLEALNQPAWARVRVEAKRALEALDKA